MASIKVKFRPSTTANKEGIIYYQIIQNRVIRQLKTDYRLFMCEWSINILLMDILFITNSLNEKISLILYKNNKRVNYENIPKLRTRFECTAY